MSVATYPGFLFTVTDFCVKITVFVDNLDGNTIRFTSANFFALYCKHSRYSGEFDCCCIGPTWILGAQY